MGTKSKTKSVGQEVNDFSRDLLNRTPEEKARDKEKETQKRLETEIKERITKYKDAGLGELVLALSSQVAKKEGWKNFSRSGRVVFGKSYKLPYSDEEIQYLKDRINEYTNK